MVLDLAVLIYFNHHIATSIQLPQVIASIARDLLNAIDREAVGDGSPAENGQERGPSVPELIRRMEESGGIVRAPTSGYLQFIRNETLVRIASEADAVIHLNYRPGHFVVEGHPLATVWPSAAATHIGNDLKRAHAAGPYRTLSQDISFAVDQLVEIAIRALSPAVNDTFTALTCVDWLGDSLCKVASRGRPALVHRDRQGYVRVITAQVSYDRLVERAHDKIRQASRGMPAVMIRQLDALAKIMQQTASVEQHPALLDQAAMIQRASVESVPEEADRADVRRRYDALLAIHLELAGAGEAEIFAEASVEPERSTSP